MRNRIALFGALAFTIAAHAGASGGGGCPGDTNGDNAVDFADLNAVLSSFNQAIDPPGSGPDVVADGQVNFADLNLVISSFNTLCAFDARIVSLNHPASALGGQPLAVTVTLRHNAPEPADIPIVIVLGPNMTDHVVEDVPPNADVEAMFNLAAPNTSPPCSTGEPVAIGACVMLFGDANPDNDCAASELDLASPHADLRFTILNAPSSVASCGQATWTVRVRNHGNVASVATCFHTGINCFSGSGAGQWSCHMGLESRIIPALEPGDTEQYAITYPIPCWAIQIQQWIKVEIGSMTGCFDACANGNYDEEPIDIVPPPG